MSADVIVPEPGNPQALNRYGYVYNNPLRYTDPSGRYTEEEIMRSFGAKSWDEVLALFRQGGRLEGRWGWLEVLRRAEDGDMVYSRSRVGNIPSESITAWLGGFFSRNDKGEILVNGRSNVEFALRFEEYWLRGSGIPPADPTLFSDAFYTRADWIHYHPHLVWGIPNRDDALIDFYGIAFDAIGTLALANLEAGPVAVGVGGLAYGMGIAIDVGQFSEGILQMYGYRYTGHFNSDHVLDVISIVPGVGAATDVMSLLSNLTGLRVDVTP